jgi:hypothetical protein
MGGTGKIDILVDGQLVGADGAAITSGRYSLIVEGRSYQARIWQNAMPPQRNSLCTWSL